MGAFVTRAAEFASLPKADQRRLRELATADARRTPLQTPAIKAWRAQGCRGTGVLWQAAAWEAAALDAVTEARRVTALMYARMIVAIAKHETAPEYQGAA